MMRFKISIWFFISVFFGTHFLHCNGFSPGEATMVSYPSTPIALIKKGLQVNWIVRKPQNPLQVYQRGRLPLEIPLQGADFLGLLQDQRNDYAFVQWNSLDGGISLVNLVENSAKRLIGYPQPVKAIWMGQQKNQTVVQALDESAKMWLWDAQTGIRNKQIQLFLPKAPIASAAFDETGQFVFLATATQIEVWDIVAGTQVTTQSIEGTVSNLQVQKNTVIAYIANNPETSRHSSELWVGKWDRNALVPQFHKAIANNLATLILSPDEEWIAMIDSLGDSQLFSLVLQKFIPFEDKVPLLAGTFTRDFHFRGLTDSGSWVEWSLQPQAKTSTVLPHLSSNLAFSRSGSWSPDGNKLLTKQDENTISVWNLQNLTLPPQLQSTLSSSTNQAEIFFSANGRYAYSVSHPFVGPKNSWVWDAERKGTQISPILANVATGGYGELSFSQTGFFVAADNVSSGITLFQANSNGILTNPVSIPEHFPTFSPSDLYVATLKDKATVDIWFVADPTRPLFTLSYPPPDYFGYIEPDFHFSPNQKYVTMTYYPGDPLIKPTLLVWSLESPSPTLIYKGSFPRNPGENSIQFSPNSNYLLHQDYDRHFIYLPLPTGGPYPFGNAVSVVVSPDGAYFATTAQFGAISIWEFTPGAAPKNTTTFAGISSTLRPILFSPDSKMLFVSTGGNNHSEYQFEGWDLSISTAPKQVILGSQSDPILAWSFSTDQKYLWTQTSKQVCFWNWHQSGTLHPLITINSNSNQFKRASLASTGNWFITDDGGGNQLTLWNLTLLLSPKIRQGQDWTF